MIERTSSSADSMRWFQRPRAPATATEVVLRGVYAPAPPAPPPTSAAPAAALTGLPSGDNDAEAAARTAEGDGRALGAPWPARRRAAFSARGEGAVPSKAGARKELMPLRSRRSRLLRLPPGFRGYVIVTMEGSAGWQWLAPPGPQRQHRSGRSHKTGQILQKSGKRQGVNRQNSLTFGSFAGCLHR